MDSHFWDDKKHPLDKCPGIIFLDVSPDKPECAVNGLARFYGFFAKHWSLDWWTGIKARVSEFRFVIKMRTREGRIAEDEYWVTPERKLLTRTIR